MLHLTLIAVLAPGVAALAPQPAPAPQSTGEPVVLTAPLTVDMTTSGPLRRAEGRGAPGLVLAGNAGWVEFDLDVSVAGRYRCELAVAGADATSAGGTVTAWVEDYVGNPDGRTYDITAPMTLPRSGGTVAKDGSPLDVGTHRMRLHHAGGTVTARSLRFTLMKRHQLTPTTLVQRTDGTEWTLVWADEFDVDGAPDASRWTADVGNWGWGNREPQYYTEGRLENARCEQGNLIIEARRDDLGQPWTSARLTTRGKVSFLYGRVEIRAKVPVMDGTWAAGWFLGDAYRDEKSWPYCGEIDVLEGVGREIDDETGDGKNHASCHTRAYYFKQGNHISNSTAVPRMGTEFHVYALEWHRDRITIEIDGRSYYVYDKTNGPLEWPFDQPQNLILNLAMGGGMGQAIDPRAKRQQFVIDYVRVYGRR